MRIRSRYWPFCLGLFLCGQYFGFQSPLLLAKDEQSNLSQNGFGYVIGLAFAFGWTPCVGPVLAAILFLAGSKDTAWHGAGLLFAYSLGIGLPFLAASLFAKPFMQMMGKAKKHMGLIEKTMGGLLVITGVLFMTGMMSTMAFWLLEAFPVLGKIG